MFRKKLGLALGGGGAKGFAHIGVLKFLEDNNINADYVSGTSIGAIIGAFHCLGYKATEIEKIVRETNFKFFLDIGAPRKGLIKGDRIESYLRRLFLNKKFSDLKKPLFIVACDIKNSQKVIFHEGDLAKAIRASISIPGIFRPVMTKDRIFVDGGVLDNLPIKVLRDQNIKSVIAVNLEAEEINKEVYETSDFKEVHENFPNIMTTLLRTSALITSAPLEKALKESKNTVIISPDLKDIKIQNFNKAEEAIQKGYEAAQEKFYELKRLQRISWGKQFMP